MTFRGSYATQLKAIGAAARDFAALLDEERKQKPSDAEFDAIAAKEAQVNATFKGLTKDINAYCAAK